jgi:acetyl esterase
MAHMTHHKPFNILAAWAAAVLLVSGSSLALAQAPIAPAKPTKPAKAPRPDKDMKAVLDTLAGLGGKPLETLTPAEARQQPTPTDAVHVLLKKKNGKTVEPEQVGKVEDREIDGPAGNKIPIRVYTPRGQGPFPIIVYYHGGGWVIANLDTYDATPRALANSANAIVVSSHYRQAPEHKFPAAHDDAFAAYKWAQGNAVTLGADPDRIAVAGESAGGNLAINVAIRARDEKRPMPVHMLLVYPVAGNDMTTPSYLANADAKPLGRAGMEWFVSQVFADKAKTDDPRLNLVGRSDLAGLPPATVITAEIDPLRSEGQTLAAHLKEQGVKVNAIDVRGVTHEFFGMAAVLPKAKKAQAQAGKDLKAAFAKAPASTKLPPPASLLPAAEPAKAPKPEIPDIAKEPGAPKPEPKGPAAPTAPPSK